jgi:hypothetical protein
MNDRRAEATVMLFPNVFGTVRAFTRELSATLRRHDWRIVAPSFKWEDNRAGEIGNSSEWGAPETGRTVLAARSSPLDLARVVQHAVTRAGWTLVKLPDQARHEKAPEWPSALFSIIRALTRAVLVIVHGSANHPAQRHPWLERSEPMLRGIRRET